MVSCEGYDSSEDQYVLRGSCGLEYNLDYTELGLRKLRESGETMALILSLIIIISCTPQIPVASVA